MVFVIPDGRRPIREQVRGFWLWIPAPRLASAGMTLERAAKGGRRFFAKRALYILK